MSLAKHSAKQATEVGKRRARTIVHELRRRSAERSERRHRRLDDPRLLFRPATGDWYIEHGDRWHRAERDSDIDALLGLLPVEVIEEDRLTTEVSPGDLVRVVGDITDPSLEFLGSYGEQVRKAVNLVPLLTRVVAEWEEGAHDDGWIETNAVIRLDGARQCWLEVFLPERDDTADKELAVQVTQGRRVVVDVHHLHRGTTTRVDLFRSRHAARGVEVTLHSSFAEPVDDERPLGFQLVRVQALA